MSDEAGYMYLWEYVVREDSVAEFERVYGPDGDWVRLFRKADGYLGTHLYRDQQVRGRYVTVDTWTSETAHGKFRSRQAAEFEALDRACERLTLRETPLGTFRAVLPARS